METRIRREEQGGGRPGQHRPALRKGQCRPWLPSGATESFLPKPVPGEAAAVTQSEGNHNDKSTLRGKAD